MPSYIECTTDQGTFDFATLEGPQNWETWRRDIQALLEAKDLWQVTTGEDSKPTKPPLPGPDACATQQQRYRIACQEYMERLRAWERKSTLAFVLIITACEDELTEYIEEHEYCYIAFMLLHELYEPMPRAHKPRLNAAVKTPLNSLAHELANNCTTVAEVVWKVPFLVRKCMERGYSVPQWMLCHFFLNALNLTDRETLELRVAEAKKSVELTIEDIVEVLGDDRYVGP